MSIPTIEEIRQAYDEITDIMKDITTVEQCRELAKRLGFTIEINGFSVKEYANQYKSEEEANTAIDWIRVENYEMLSYVYFHKDGPVMFDVWCDDVDADFLIDITIDKLEDAYADGVKWVEEQQVSEINEYRYSLLSRLKMDCDYYLGASNGYEGHLWAKTVEAQIEEMKRLYNGFSEDKKPEWLTMEDILEYETKMMEFKESKKGDTLYGIGVLPEESLPYSQGYRYAAYIKDATKETYLKELVEFFKTEDEVQQFVNEHPEYGKDNTMADIVQRPKGRGR